MIFHDYQTNRKKRINWLCKTPFIPSAPSKQLVTHPKASKMNSATT
jgi:hypothetical protein